MDTRIDLADKRYVNDARIETLQKNYRGLEVIANGRVLETSGLTIDDIRKMLLDLKFLEQNPGIPNENLCNHLDNYNPRNASQEQLLMYARRLIGLDRTTAAGLFVYGQSGVGKSHISVALTKEFMARGLDARYCSADRVDAKIAGQLGPGQAWIVDDLNSPYGLGMDAFKKIVLNAHERGGRVFVTSNVSFDHLMEHGFVLDQGEKSRYVDRMRGMFKIIAVTGDSQRERDAWYKPFAVIQGSNGAK